MKSLTTYFVIFLFFPILLLSQAIVFQKSYDFSFDDKFNDFVATPDGEFILVGTTMASPYVTNMLIVKTDEHGDMIWSKIYGADSSCHANRIIHLVNDNYLIAGSYGNPMQAYILKIDSQGDSLNSYFFPNEYGSTCVDVVEIENSDILLIQQVFLLPTASNIIYADSNGNINWEKLATANESNNIHMISDDEFYVTVYNGLVNYAHNILTKYNLQGTIIQNTEFSSFNGINICSAIWENVVYMGGMYESTGAYPACVMKTDFEGQLFWYEIYFSVAYSSVNSIVPIDEEQIITCGDLDDQIFVMRINSEGDSIKGILLNNYDKQSGNAMMYMDDHLLIAGNNNGGGSHDAYFIKLHLDTLSTGIIEPKLDIISQLTIFPNPANEYIDVEIPMELHGQTFELVIHNNLGNKVYQKGYSGDVNLDISNFDTGIYFLTIVTQNNTFISNKFIKK